LSFKVALLAAATAICAACERAHERLLQPPDTAPIATAQCVGVDSTGYYVPLRQNDAPYDDPFRQSLRIAQSDDLSCGPAREAYRVFWLPSFRNVRIITVSLIQSRWRLTSVDFGDRLWTEWKTGDAPTSTVKQLSSAEVDRVRDELTAADFWLAVPHKTNPSVMDGRVLIIEGRSGDRYRAITRVNEWDGAERIACVLFQIAGLELPEYPKCPEPVSLPR